MDELYWLTEAHDGARRNFAGVFDNPSDAAASARLWSACDRADLWRYEDDRPRLIGMYGHGRRVRRAEPARVETAVECMCSFCPADDAGGGGQGYAPAGEVQS